MAKKTTSQHQKNLYKVYKDSNRWANNRLAKLERYCKANPNDIQAANALKAAQAGALKYRRRRSGGHVCKPVKTIVRNTKRSPKGQPIAVTYDRLGYTPIKYVSLPKSIKDQLSVQDGSATA